MKNASSYRFNTRARERKDSTVKDTWNPINDKSDLRELPISGSIVRINRVETTPMNAIFVIVKGRMWGFYTIPDEKLIADVTHWKYLPHKEESKVKHAYKEAREKAKEKLKKLKEPDNE